MTEEKKDAIEQVKPQTEAIIPDMRNMISLARYLLQSRMFPNVKSEAEVITVIEYGRELGIPPAAALNTMVVINGKLAMEAKALLAVANKRAGVSWKVDEINDNKCKMTFRRDGFKDLDVEFTYQEATNAGLTGKSNWKNYRQDMLFARCASRGIRRIAPDAVLGLYSTEEMVDVPAKEPLPADAEIVDEKVEADIAIPPSTLPPEVAKKKPGRPTNKFKALEEYGKIKKEMGSGYYYSVLHKAGYEHANLIPEDKLRDVYAELKKVKDEFKIAIGKETEEKAKENG